MVEYSEKTYKKILKAQMDRVSDDVDKREGSLIQTALGPQAWYLEGVYMELKHEVDNAFIDTAVGKDLERRARECGVDVKAATYAERAGEFNIEIPIGSRFSAPVQSASIIYRADELIGEEKGVWKYLLRCESAGSIGNDYSGDILPITTIQGLETARLTDILSAGSEREGSEALRERTYAHLRNPSTGGNRYDYLQWATEVEGVGAARIFPLADGPGTVKVVIVSADMTPAGTALIEKASDHIEELRPVGATVLVVSAVEKKISITAKVRLSNGVVLGSAQEMFRKAVTEYLDKQAFSVNYISLARIGNILMSVGGVEDYSDLRLNGEAENVTLSDQDIAVLDVVHLEVMA